MNSNPIRNLKKDRQEIPSGTIFDYLAWRGDIPFSRVLPGCVDALIFSTLAYVDYDGLIPQGADQAITLYEVVQRLNEQENFEERCFFKRDRELLDVAAESQRFRSVRLCGYKTVFIPEEETQFAAITFLLEDGTAFLAFRGTDHSIVGWKEDFNMAFQDSVPAQRLAQEYVQAFAGETGQYFRLGGHSKGGNLAVYAAAKSPRAVQSRILDVYNHDGPGFTQAMMEDPGYLAMVPQIRTYVPQSSVVGLLLERKEPIIIIKSYHISVMQHDPYTWAVLGGSFITVEELTSDSRFLDKTLQGWLAEMTMEERNEFIEAVFGGMLQEGGSVKSLLKPQNIRSYLSTLRLDEERRKTIASVLLKLLDVAKKAGQEPEGESGAGEE